MNDNLLSPNDIDVATRCTEGAGYAQFRHAKGYSWGGHFYPDLPVQPSADAFV
jgi:hypothetical protein